MSVLQTVYEILRGRKPEQGNPPFDPSQVPGGDQQQKKVVDEGELISFVENEFQRRKKERLPFENLWKLIVNFLESNQYIDINPVSQALEEIPKVFEWQEREVFNLMAPNIETRLSRLSRMRPILKVRPGSNDPDDVRATKIGDHLLKNTYYDKKMLSKQSDVNTWLETNGTCLMKHTWNPQLGKFVGYDDTVVEGNPQEVHEGDIDTIVCPAAEIFPDSCYHQEIE
ncbi:MAG: hypothetical protein M0P69_18090, partial [Bacteroidales bacterium]|nr:hypothetical protein [Bacteroidales bacterium]